jgi:RES domain-containing protein
MEVYRISIAKYSKKLSASGAPNRWNGENQYVIYAAESRALAALEMVAHRSSKMKKDDFKILTISLPDSKKFIEEIPVSTLPANWKTMKAYSQLQRLGGEWYRSKRKLILKVPSVLVKEEYNYVINTNHSDFEKHVVLKGIEDFKWDNRLF